MMRVIVTMLRSVILLTLVAQTAFAASEKDYDKVRPMEFSASEVSKKYLPKIKISNGCYPYTAVDRFGNYSKGQNYRVKNRAYKCKEKDKQQVYSRVRVIKSKLLAVMYAYYFPKDAGAVFGKFGHRHDWEHVVVFVGDYRSKNEKIVGVAYSGHGGVTVTKKPNRSGNGIYAHYAYHKSLTHSFREGNSGSNDKHILLNWNDIPEAAKDTLNNQSFGHAIVPFRDRGMRFAGQIKIAHDALKKK